MSAAPPRLLCLCADDFGQTPGISQGIADLARHRRLNAIACLTNGRHWPSSAALLSKLPDTVECGLHFNLTEGVPLSPELREHWPRLPSLRRLVLQAHGHWLPIQALRSEWRAQWQAFVQATGRAPQFVDGHQHVHHLPGVRATVLNGAAAANVPVRNTGRVHGPGNALKRWLIEYTGGKALRRQLRQRGLAHNPALTGVYGFDGTDYRSRMQAWLAAVPADGALLFCHPAAGLPDPADPIGAARLREAAYLGSRAFRDDLAAAGVRLGRVWTKRSSGG